MCSLSHAVAYSQAVESLAEVTPLNHLVLTRVEPLPDRRAVGSTADPVMLEVFNNLFMSIAEQMGLRLNLSPHAPAKQPDGIHGIPMRLKTYSLDQPGIVHRVTHLLLQFGDLLTLSSPIGTSLAHVYNNGAYHVDIFDPSDPVDITPFAIDSFILTPTPSAVPEPTSWLLLGTGILAFVFAAATRKLFPRSH